MVPYSPYGANQTIESSICTLHVLLKNCGYWRVGIGGDDVVSGLICMGYFKYIADRWQWLIYQLLMKRS